MSWPKAPKILQLEGSVCTFLCDTSSNSPWVSAQAFTRLVIRLPHCLWSGAMLSQEMLTWSRACCLLCSLRACIFTAARPAKRQHQNQLQHEWRRIYRANKWAPKQVCAANFLAMLSSKHFVTYKNYKMPGSRVYVDEPALLYRPESFWTPTTTEVEGTSPARVVVCSRLNSLATRSCAVLISSVWRSRAFMCASISWRLDPSSSYSCFFLPQPLVEARRCRTALLYPLLLRLLARGRFLTLHSRPSTLIRHTMPMRPSIANGFSELCTPHDGRRPVQLRLVRRKSPGTHHLIESSHCCHFMSSMECGTSNICCLATLATPRCYKIAA